MAPPFAKVRTADGKLVAAAVLKHLNGGQKRDCINDFGKVSAPASKIDAGSTGGIEAAEKMAKLVAEMERLEAENVALKKRFQDAMFDAQATSAVGEDNQYGLVANPVAASAYLTFKNTSRKLRAANDDLATVRTQLAEKDAALAVVTEKLYLIEKERDEALEEVEKRQAHISVVEQSLAQGCTEYLEKHQAVTKERNAIVQERDAAIQDRDDAIKDLDAARKERDDVVEKLRAAEQAVQDHDALIKERDEANEQCNNFIEDNFGLIEKLETALQDLEEAVEEREAINDKYNRHSQVSRNLTDSLKAQLADAVTMRDSVIEQFRNTMQKFDAVVQKYKILDEENKSQAAQLGSLIQQLETAHKQRDLANQKRKDLSGELEASYKQRGIADKKHKALSGEIQARATSLGDIIIKLEAAQKERDRTVKERELVVEKLKALNGEPKALKGKLEAAHKQRDLAVEKHRVLNNELQAQTTALSDVKLQLDAVHKEREEAIANATSMQKRIVELETHIIVAKERESVQAAAVKMLEGLTHRTASLEVKLEQTREELVNETSDYYCQMVELEIERAHLLRDLAAARKAQAVNVNLALLQTETAKLKTENSTFKVENAKFKTENVTFKAENVMLKSDKANIEGNVRHYPNLINTLCAERDTFQGQLQDAIRERNDAYIQYDNANMQAWVHAGRCADLEVQLAGEKHVTKENMKTLLDVQKKYFESKNMVHRLEIDNVAAKKELEDAVTDFDARTTRFMDAKTPLESQFIELHNEIKDLKRLIGILQNDTRATKCAITAWERNLKKNPKEERPAFDTCTCYFHLKLQLEHSRKYEDTADKYLNKLNDDYMRAVGEVGELKAIIARGTPMAGYAGDVSGSATDATGSYTDVSGLVTDTAAPCTDVSGLLTEDTGCALEAFDDKALVIKQGNTSNVDESDDNASDAESEGSVEFIMEHDPHASRPPKYRRPIVEE